MSDPRDRVDMVMGHVDDVVICNVAMFRLEDMGHGFWMKLYMDNGEPDHVFFISAMKRGSIKITYDTDTPAHPVDSQ